MSSISVTRDGTSTSPIIWVDKTAWVGEAINRHVTVSGGRGLGRTFPKGTDNAVCTLQGRVLDTVAGRQALEALASSTLTVDDGVQVRTGIAGSPTVSESSNRSWIFFSITVTEV